MQGQRRAAGRAPLEISAARPGSHPLRVCGLGSRLASGVPAALELLLQPGQGLPLARGGQKVALIDADIGLRNLDVVLGLEGRIVYDLIDVIEGLCGVEQAIIPSDDIPGLWLLPASQSHRQDSVQPGQMREVVAKLAERFDWVLIDCPAGVEQGFYNAVLCADVAIVEIRLK